MKKIENRYKNEQGELYHSDKHLLNDEVKDFMSETRVKKFLKFVNSDTVLLEYGVGGGFNISKLVCKEKHGFDIAISVKEQIEKLGIKFINNEEDIPNNYYDVIICNHVLEHVPNPPETLSIIKSKLKDDGTFVLVVPFETIKKYSKFNPNDKDFHLYSWNVQTITYLVSQIGFKCIETKVLYYGFDRFTAHLITKYHLPKFSFNLIFKTLNFLRPTREILLVLKKQS